MKKIMLTVLAAILLIGCVGCAGAKQSADDPLPSVKTTDRSAEASGTTLPDVSKTDAPTVGTDKSPSPQTTDEPTPGTTAQKPETGSDEPTGSDKPTTSKIPETSHAPITTTEEPLPEPEIPHTHSYTKTDEKTTTATENGQTVKTTVTTYTCDCGASYTDTKTETVVENHTHSYTSQVTKAATCTDNGVMTYTCSCGDHYTETIQATGHNWKKIYTNEATCTSNGYDEFTCENCAASYKDNYTAKKPHDYQKWGVSKDAGCETDGYITWKCKNCIAIYEETIPATGHSWSKTKTVAPTCKAGGYDLYTCDKCKSTEHRNETAKTNDHSYTSQVTKAATCTADGVKTYTCSVCGNKRTESIPATGHSYDSGKITTQPTCEGTGVKTYTCKNCKGTKTESIPAVGHNWIKTAETRDFIDWYCTKCHTSKHEILSSGKPDPDPEPEIKAPTEAELEEMAEYFLQLLNAERAKMGARQLVTSDKLHEMAQVRADELTVLFEHNRPDGTSSRTIWTEFEYGIPNDFSSLGYGIIYYPDHYSEDIGASTSMEGAMIGLKNSPGHWSDVTDNAYGAVGIGVSYGYFEEYDQYLYYVEVLLVDKLYE